MNKPAVHPEPDRDERLLAWASGPEGAALDLGLALRVRRHLRAGDRLPALVAAEGLLERWKRARRERAREPRSGPRPIQSEPVVLAALRALCGAEIKREG